MISDVSEKAAENDLHNFRLTERMEVFSSVWMTLIAPLVVGAFVSEWFSAAGGSLSLTTCLFAIAFVGIHGFLAYCQFSSRKKEITHYEVDEIKKSHNSQVEQYNSLRSRYKELNWLHIVQSNVIYLISMELDKAVGELSELMRKEQVPLESGLLPLTERHLEAIVWPLIVNRESLFGYAEQSLYNLALYVYDKNSDSLIVKKRFCDSRIVQQNRCWRPGMGHVGMAFLHKELKICPDISESTELRTKSDSDRKTYRSFISVPIIACEDDENTENKPHGVLVLTSAHKEQFDVQRDQIFLLTVSKLLAIYLDKVAHTEQVLEHSACSHGEAKAG